MTQRGSPARREPFFSVIVPAYAVQGFLRACMDSIVTQSFTDFEVLAVDDCSPDNSGAVLDAYAAADPRVSVIHLDANVGLGLARQAALAHATGRYVLFVDSDDVVAPGSFAAIADRLVATNEPDIVIFDYERTWTRGRRLRNVLHRYLAKSGPDVFTIGERKELLTLLMVVWNKAYKREFIEKFGFTFGAGYYEDTPWTYPTLLTARSITTLDRVCIHYRQRRTGSILSDPGRRHFDVFDQYDRLFAFIDDHAELEEWRGFLFGRMMSHYFTILTRKQRIHRSQRREFFARVGEHYRRYKPPGTKTPGGVDGAKWRLVAARAFRLFFFLSALSRISTNLRGDLKRLRRALRNLAAETVRALRRGYYRIQLRLPLDENLAVYAAYWYRDYACSPKAIDRAARQLVPHVKSVWAVRRDAKVQVPDDVAVVYAGTLPYYRAIARAKYLINNVNFPNHVAKRRGAVHIQTHHGTPLKTMGVDLQAFPVAAGEMDFDNLLHRTDRWDYSLSSNTLSSEVWEHAYPAAYTTLESGLPRNDRLFAYDESEVHRIRRSLGIDDERTAVLYLPTHRDYHTGYVAMLDLAEVAAGLGPDYVILVRAHYFYRGGNAAVGDDVAAAALVDVSHHQDVEELYLASDVMVTDYSSAMFDYANLDRPIVIFAPDYDVYEVTRGTYFDLMAIPPGPITHDEEEVIAAFRSGVYADATSAAKRARFRELFCQFDDGHAAERVVRTAFLGEPPPRRHGAVLPVAVTATERLVPPPKDTRAGPPAEDEP
jgi:CDP-glycerol glycerophosphotransferase (TagB/SpsB family)/glycosyltransferase involved in cell wall biosynthesis